MELSFFYQMRKSVDERDTVKTHLSWIDRFTLYL